MDRTLARFLVGSFLLLSFRPITQSVGQEPLSRVGLPGETAVTARRLAAADKLLVGEQWADAIAEYQRILDEAGDDLVPIHPRLSLQARQLCQLRLAALPPQALSVYRARVDAQAKKWLEQGDSEREPRWWRKIVEDTFASRFGDQALDRLGDTAFEQGRYDEAEHWWRMIVPPAEHEGADSNKAAPVDFETRLASSLNLAYPDPQVEVARIRAKQLLARWFRGDLRNWKDDLTQYRAAHGKTEGNFAGRRGPYADRLKELVENLESRTTAVATDNWPTFAGGPTRSHLAAAHPGRLERRSPLEPPNWSWHLNRAADRPPSELPARKVVPPSEQARSLAFYPVIVGDKVLVADARYVRAFDLQTGNMEVWFDLITDGRQSGLELPLKLPADADLRYTLTVSGDRVFARMGGQHLGPRKEPQGKTSPSFVVCLALNNFAGTRLRWIVKSDSTDKSAEYFEGAPIVHEGGAYVAVTRFDGAATTTAIACYDAESGLPRWRRPVDVCEVHDFLVAERRVRHHLVSLAGSKIVYCSHSGAIAALDAATGRRAWGVRYASRGDKTAEGQPSPRDLSPCIYAGQRLIVAPVDYERVLCLDLNTGQTLWESEPPTEVVHLLGIIHDRLICTTPHDIRALALSTGRPLRDWMYPLDHVKMAPFGRGIVTEKAVYWPTENGLRVLDIDTGQPISSVAYNYQPNDLRGNLAAGNGCLVFADAEKLHALVPPARFLNERRKDARADPDSMKARFRLALAEADAGQFDLAYGSFITVERSANPKESLYGETLRNLAQHRRFEWLMQQAGGAQSSEDAIAQYRKAAADDFSIPQRLNALAQLADLYQRTNQHERAVATWQAILDDETLRRGMMLETALPQVAGQVATASIDALLKEHGRMLYGVIESRAKAMFTQAGNGRSRETFETLVAQFPNSNLTGAVWLQLAQAYEKQNRLGQLTHALRQALRHKFAADERAATLAKLARVYEKQACWHAARSAWQRLAELPDQRSLAEVAIQNLARQTNPPGPVHWSFPLERTWHSFLKPGPLGPEAFENTRLLHTDAGSLDCGGQWVFIAGGHEPNVSLTCLDAKTGTTRWQRTFGHSLTWINQYADFIIVAGSNGVHGITVSEGTSLWDWDREAVDSVSGAEVGAKSVANGFGSFHLRGALLYFLHNDQRLFALDAETGRVAWSRWAPGAVFYPPAPQGKFNPHIHVGDSTVVLQAGHRCLMLECSSGRTVSARETSAEPWPQAPFAFPPNIYLLHDESHLALLDETTGQELWKQSIGKPSVTGTAPHMVSDGRTLVVFVDGWRIERRDPKTGSVIWSVGDPNWLQSNRQLEEFAALDAEAVYFVKGSVLHALGLVNGKQLWEQRLPASRASWKVVRSHDAIFTYPATFIPRTPWILGSAAFAFPPLIPMQDFPIEVHDPKDGRLIQRISFPAEQGASVQVLNHDLVFATSSEVWGMRESKR